MARNGYKIFDADTAEAKKRHWEINPVSGERLEALAKEMINQPADIVERMKKLMGES